MLTEEKKILYTAILCGIVAVLFSYFYLDAKRNELEKQYKKIKVVIAKRDIPEKTLLQNNMFKVKEIPEEFIEPKAIRVKNFKQVTEVGQTNGKQVEEYSVKGFVNMVPLFEGQQVVKSALLPPSLDTGLSVKITPGRRALIIPVKKNITELIKPGNYVDIVCIFDAVNKSGRKVKVASTVLQSIKVLSVGQDLAEVRGKTIGRKKQALGIAEATVLAISVLVTPAEAQVLTLAQEQGFLSVSLRRDDDTEEVKIKTIDSSFLLR